MNAASLSEIKKELGSLEPGALQHLCLRLARYKKENKELLTYLLFEAADEGAYVAGIKREVDELFLQIRKGNIYFVKKGVRKILRHINKHIRYSGVGITELELRIHYCENMVSGGIPLGQSTALHNIYRQQLKKSVDVWSKLPEDLQLDYQDALRSMHEHVGLDLKV